MSTRGGEAILWCDHQLKAGDLPLWAHLQYSRKACFASRHLYYSGNKGLEMGLLIAAAIAVGFGSDKLDKIR